MITPTNSFAPSLSVGDGTLTVTIGSGSIYIQGVLTALPVTNVVCGANATTFIYMSLATRILTTSTSGFPVNCYPIATAVTTASKFSSLVDNRPDAAYNGLEYLGFGITAAGTVTVPFETRDWVEARVRIRFYSIADIVSIQFNGDTANNYCSRAVTMPTGGTVWTNDIDLNTTSAIRLAPTAITGNRSVSLWFGNVANKEKIVFVHPASTSGAVGTGLPIQLATGAWFNTAAQVNSITMFAIGGNNFGADIAIYGRNFN